MRGSMKVKFKELFVSKEGLCSMDLVICEFSATLHDRSTIIYMLMSPEAPHHEDAWGMEVLLQTFFTSALD